MIFLNPTTFSLKNNRIKMEISYASLCGKHSSIFWDYMELHHNNNPE